LGTLHPDLQHLVLNRDALRDKIKLPRFDRAKDMFEGISGLIEKVSEMKSNALAREMADQLLIYGIWEKIPGAADYLATSYTISKGWTVSVEKDIVKAIPGMHRPRHITGRIFSCVRKIMAGEHVFDGNLQFVDVPQGPVIGHVKDKTIRQLLLLSSQIKKVRAKEGLKLNSEELDAMFASKSHMEYLHFMHSAMRLAGLDKFVQKLAVECACESSLDSEAVSKHAESMGINVTVSNDWNLILIRADQADD
ncbi:MAG: hypothetical protein JWO73_525, partial [Candidatus Taylorbacteria bacterium]|nr:hypothetical protein [Candidatus Taylorbacteria bacterium]